MVINFNPARVAIEKMYIGSCDVRGKQESVDAETGETTREDVVLYTDVPCYLSSTTAVHTASFGNIGKAVREVELFLAPEISIPTGAKITVRQNGITADYAQTSRTEMYPTHQQVFLTSYQVTV